MKGTKTEYARIVKKVHECRAAGMTLDAIAKKYDRSLATISRIAREKYPAWYQRDVIDGGGNIPTGPPALPPAARPEELKRMWTVFQEQGACMPTQDLLKLISLLRAQNIQLKHKLDFTLHGTCEEERFGKV